jgi:hypothetical protein
LALRLVAIFGVGSAKRNRRVALARYVLRATGEAGPVEFQEQLTIEEALAKAVELRDAHFSHITICNVRSGVEITDLEALLDAQAGDDDSVR